MKTQASLYTATCLALVSGALACSRTPTGGGAAPITRQDAAPGDGSNLGRDGAQNAGDGAPSGGDGAQSDPDADNMSIDSGEELDSGEDDGGEMSIDAGDLDAGGGGTFCLDLALCCQSVPPGQLQMQCVQTAMAGDEGRCMQALQIADRFRRGNDGGPPPPRDGGQPGRDSGIPLRDAGNPPGNDGGNPVGDGGNPTSPECARLAMCCVNIPPNSRLRGRCDFAVMQGNANDCRVLYPVVQQYCPAMDAGIPPRLDAGGFFDSGVIFDANIPPFDAGGGRRDAGTGRLDIGFGFDVNIPPLPDAGQGVACMELAMCCPTLPNRLQLTCNNVVMRNFDTACRQTLGTAQMSGYCLPDAGTSTGGGSLDAGLGTRD